MTTQEAIERNLQRQNALTLLQLGKFTPKQRAAISTTLAPGWAPVPSPDPRLGDAFKPTQDTNQ